MPDVVVLDGLLHILGAGHAAGGIGHFEGAAIAVRGQGVFDAQHLAAADAPIGLAGQVHGQGRASAVAVAQGDDLLVARVGPGQHHRVLVGLRARIGEIGRAQIPRRDLGDLFGQTHMVFVGIEGGRVDQLGGLGLGRRGHLGVVVAHAGGQDAAEEVQIFVPLHIPHPQPFAVVQGHGLRVIEQMVGPQILFLLLQDLLGVHGAS